MTAHDPHGSVLSVHRAFVVHFGSDTGAPRRRFVGRVEHLSSGDSLHFSSLNVLLAFIASHIGPSAADRPVGRGGSR